MAIGMVASAAMSVKAAVDWETAFTGVRKTINGSEADFKRLETGIRSMAQGIPVAATDLAGIAESAGQLGIKKNAILGFTRVVADMGVATNLVGEEGATAMAKIANITQMAQGDFDRLGSTIVALGNNGASTEQDIAMMAMRIAGAGHQVGMTQSDILAYSNALSSVGMEADAGGSAISRVFTMMAKDVRAGGSDLSLMGRVAGMTGQQFKRAFESDAATATNKFITGLGKMQKAGGDVFGVLDELEMKDIRVQRAMLALAGSGTVLTESLATGRAAWEANTALTTEAERRYATTASQLKILGNHAREVGISMGTAFLPGVNSAAKLGVSLLQTGAAIKLLSVAAGALLGRMVALGAVWAVGQVAAFAGALRTAAVALQLIGTAAMSGQLRALPGLFAAGGMSAAALAGPVGLIAGGGIVAAAALGAFNSKAKETAVTAQDAADAVNNYKNAMLGLSDARLGVNEAKLQVAAARENLDVMKRQGTTGVQLAQAKQAVTRAVLSQMQAEQRLNDESARSTRTTRETVQTLLKRGAQLSTDIGKMRANGAATEAIAAKQRELNNVLKQVPSAAAQASRGAQSLIRQYGNVPKIIKTVMQTDDAAALNKLNTLAGRLAKVDGKKATAKILAESGSAEAAIANIRARLDALNGKTAHTYVVNTTYDKKGNANTRIRGRAGGGRVGAAEALTLVGERGPEIVSLPTGAYVHTAGQTMAMLRDAGMESFAGGGRKKGRRLSRQEKRDRWNERIQSRSRVLDLIAQRKAIGAGDLAAAEAEEAVGRRHLAEAKRLKGKGRAEAIQQALLEIAQAEHRQNEARAQQQQDANDALVEAAQAQTAALEAQTAAINASVEERRKTRELAERVHTAHKSVTDTTLQGILDKTLAGRLSQMMLTLSPRMAT